MDAVYVYLLARGIQLLDEGKLEELCDMPDHSIGEAIDMFVESIRVDDMALGSDVGWGDYARLQALTAADAKLMELAVLKDEQREESSRVISMRPLTQRLRQVYAAAIRAELRPAACE